MKICVAVWRKTGSQVLPNDGAIPGYNSLLYFMSLLCLSWINSLSAIINIISILHIIEKKSTTGDT